MVVAFELSLEFIESSFVCLDRDEVFLNLEGLDGGLVVFFDVPVEQEKGLELISDVSIWSLSHTLVVGLRLGLGLVEGLLKHST